MSLYDYTYDETIGIVATIRVIYKHELFSINSLCTKETRTIHYQHGRYAFVESFLLSFCEFYK